MGYAMMQDEVGRERGWYVFPQYLWEIEFHRITDERRMSDVKVYIRRGNTPEEVADKGVIKDMPYMPGEWIVGVLDTCDIRDAWAYSISHKWDWLNE